MLCSFHYSNQFLKNTVHLTIPRRVYPGNLPESKAEMLKLPVFKCCPSVVYHEHASPKAGPPVSS